MYKKIYSCYFNHFRLITTYKFNIFLNISNILFFLFEKNMILDYYNVKKQSYTIQRYSYMSIDYHLKNLVFLNCDLDYFT